MAEQVINYTKALKRLEEIVKSLESSDVDLDVAIKLLEEGVKLHKACTTKLNDFQGKIEEILKDIPSENP